MVIALVLIVLSGDYAVSIVLPSRRGARIYALTTLLLILLAFTASAYYTLYVLAIMPPPFTAIVLIATLLYILYAALTSPKCLDKRRRVRLECRACPRLGVVEVEECKLTSLNALYNPRRRVALIDSRLRELLGDDATCAIIAHEVGHSKTIEAILAVVAHGIWALAVSTLAVLILILIAASIPFPKAVEFMIIVYMTGALLTASAALISWIAEHRADEVAAAMCGAQLVADALVKLHVYGVLDDEQVLDNVERCECRMRDTSIQVNRIMRLKAFLLAGTALIETAFTYPKLIMDILLTRTYRAHPPLSLRLMHLAALEKLGRRVEDGGPAGI